MLRFALLALAASPAIGQEAIPLRDLLDATHVHGIAGGTGGLDSVTLASHHGLWSVDLATGTATRIGTSADDFMGYSVVSGDAGQAFTSGHPAMGGNIGIIRTDDGGATWTHVSDGLDGPVDFHNLEVSRADPAVIYGIIHDGTVQRSADSGVTWEVSGQAPGELIDIATSYTDSDTIYAATEAGLFVSPDKGATWQGVTAGAPVTSVDVGADGLLRAAELGRGLLSIDAKGTVSVLSPELPDGYLLFLASTHADPHRLSALSAKGQLIFSDDGGATWTNAATD